MAVVMAVDLVFGGAGTKAAAHAGAAEALLHNSVAARVGGTSGGAIVAAALACGHAPRAILALLKDAVQPSAKVRAWPWIAYHNRAIFKDDAINAALKKALPGLMKDTVLPLRVVAYDLREQREVVFDSLTTPFVPVWLAVRASMAIPGVFPPVAWKNALLTDGGVRGNNPSGLFDDSQRTTIAVGIRTPQKARRPVKSLIGFILAVVSAVMDRDGDRSAKQHRRLKEIYLEIPGDGLDFGIDHGAIYERARRQTASQI